MNTPRLNFTPWQFGKLVFQPNAWDAWCAVAMAGGEQPTATDQALQNAVIEVDITLVELVEGRR